MKATGMVRRMDNLGRIVIPMEVRRNLNIEAGDPIEIYVDGDYIMLKKYEDEHQCKSCKSYIGINDIYCRYCGVKIGG